MTTTASPSRLAPREAYALWADSYDQDPNPLIALEERALSALLPDCRGVLVLDLACGTGRWARKLSHSGARVVGIDFSEPMLARGDAQLSLLAGDASAVPLRDGSVERVVCSLALGYFEDLGTVAGEIHRVLKPGGGVWLTDLHPDALAAGWRRSFRAGGETVDIECAQHTMAQIISAFTDAGLRFAAKHAFRFGEPERGIFIQAGRGDRFQSAATVDAIMVLHFVAPDAPQPRRASTRSAHRGIARIARNAHDAVPGTLKIEDGRIAAGRGSMPAADLSGYLLLPGLINAHDHLEFSLFPRLGRGPYRNATEWADDIHKPQQSPVREQSRVAKPVRLWWGGLKNLLCGVTTVCHHNPYEEDVFTDDFPVRVLRDFSWAHSFAFDDVAARHASADRRLPFIVHAGEGTDQTSAAEYGKLAACGALDGRTVVVHGTAFSAEDLGLLAKRGAALVWCPSSNLFTLGRTLGPTSLPPRAALGSDSALTGCGDLLDEIRCARSLGASPEELYCLVTTRGADVLGLKGGEGTLEPGAPADIIAIRDDGRAPAEQLADADWRAIELVMVRGRVRLCSPELARRIDSELIAGLSPLRINGVTRLVAAPVSDLFAAAATQLGPKLRLAGKVVEC